MGRTSRSKNDCLRQCLARLLDLPPSRVPHFVGKYRGKWIWHLARWCERRGLAMVLASHGRERGTVAGLTWWISIGTTKSGTCHAVLVHRDKGVVYDGGNPLRRHTRVLVIVGARLA